MQKLLAELSRLYLPDNSTPHDVLQRHVSGQSTVPVHLVTGAGQTRAMVIAFDKLEGDEEEHWSLLCQAANAMQAELDLPAPAVSISGAHGFRLWLSLASPVPAALAQQFIALLREAYFPAIALATDAATAPVELPPCLHQGTGRWAAFINPGLGASFADEAGLEMAPPLAGQSALLEGLKSITPAQFEHAVHVLQTSHVAVPPGGDVAPAGLLLQDATLEQIVAHLHALNIEPTFRHLLPRQ